MNMFGALMMTVTMTMTAVMLPRIYMSWIVAERYFLEGEIEQLMQLLVEQNSWVWRQFGCGAAAVAMIWMVRNSPHDLSIPTSMEAALAFYATISLLFAVLESLIAQRASGFLALVPIRAKIAEED
ncbi:hypothetical protein KOM00_09790 [Geomonas sp. Red69]|uniref:Uncharacterized protein n=1 Tax=Geomonas diazotrophica TaxID=2843197 RepID=A0ABX8JPA2_9BACT|nr:MULTISPECIES: hypothetical protein [Geomonas]MBU5637025.1 hypothetical protein [Geomonas diazotrophica]QWV98921.1 hypothetical protein KP005_06480 [Geomonas nitrogeniifigens]